MTDVTDVTDVTDMTGDASMEFGHDVARGSRRRRVRTAAPAVPAFATAPALAIVPSVATPVKTWALPAVVVPTVVLAAEKELRVFDRQDLGRREGAADGGFGRASQRQRDPRGDSERKAR